MKYFKKVNEEFEGFFDSEFNEEQIYNFSTEIKTVVEEIENEETGKIDNVTKEIEVKVKTLKENFYELEDQKWKDLLEEQTKGKKIMILKNGELGAYEYPACTKEFANKIFNWDTEQWEEGATVQEQLEYYKQKIIECTKEIYIEERAGFKPSDELLQKKEHYSNLHMQISQPEAIKINKHMDSTKPGTAQVQ